jgi:hypothetical protein
MVLVEQLVGQKALGFGGWRPTSIVDLMGVVEIRSQLLNILRDYIGVRF